MHEWINFTNYYGRSFSNPTDNQLKEALKELFKAKDNEHPSAWRLCSS
jgi:hypothetical protein